MLSPHFGAMNVHTFHYVSFQTEYHRVHILNWFARHVTLSGVVVSAHVPSLDTCCMTSPCRSIKGALTLISSAMAPDMVGKPVNVDELSTITSGTT